jgi:hypothetical protein
LAASIQAISRVVQIPSLTDVSSPQLTQLYRMAQELARADLPPTDLLTHASIDQLPAMLAERHELIKLSSDANAALEAALVGFCEVLGDN